MDKTEQIFSQFKTINALTEQQSVLERNSAGWNTLETKLIEEECKLFNNLVDLELQETEYLFEKLQILPMLGLHLYKCMFTNNSEIVNNLLSEQAKGFIILMWMYWQQVKGETIK